MKRTSRSRLFRALWTRRVFVMAIVAAALVAGREQAFAFQAAQDMSTAGQDASTAPQPVPLTQEALQQLVAPIALYPDELVAQILAASTYPTQIVEADRWLQGHSDLKEDKLAKEVDKESWDPSVKALTPFASVLENMDTNLSWTSQLGDAYFNQPEDVLAAVQSLRERAKDAGNLQNSSQQTVTSDGPTIIIEPAEADVCYVPTYDPWVVYGAPLGIYPGYIYNPWIGGPFVSYGLGIVIGGGFWPRFGWGWHSWGFNWRGRNVIFNHNPYISRSHTFFHRFPDGRGGFGSGHGRPFFGGNNGGNNGNHGDNNGPRNHDGFGGNNGRNNGPRSSGGNPGGNQGQFNGRNPGGGQFGMPSSGGDHRNDQGGNHRGDFPNPGGMNNGHDNRGFGQPNGDNRGMRSGIFGGFGQGGNEQGAAARGRGSFGGGGGGGGARGGFGGGGGRGGGGGGRGGGGRPGGGRH
jgi:hypothetical protein